MREIDKIAEGLFEKIRDRFEDVSLGDEKAKATQDPEKARFFNFDYVIDGHDHGNITISLIDETSLKVYFSKNISHDLDPDHKKEWYSFLRELREFAKRNLLSFEPRDITRSTLKHRDLQQVSKADNTYDKDEVVAESLYGTRKSSYERKGPVRLIVRHSKALDEVENRRARSHHINSIYIETQEGERFKLPVKSLRLGRALAQHLKQGGSMQDDLGRHICEMAQECAKLKPFINNTRNRTFEDTQTQDMVEAAVEYHGLLNNTLKRMTGKKGYQKCKEQFVATSTSYIPEVDTDEMKQRFEKRTFDDRLEEALPLVHKAYNMKKENKFAEQFENWADTIAEGTWAFPQSDDEVAKLIDVLSNPLPAGVDGQNATNILYDIIGDDRLFDQIAEIAKVDPEEDVRSVVENWLEEHASHIYQQIQAEIGDPDVPEPFDQGQEVDESKETRQALSDQHFEFPQQGQYGYRQGYKGRGVLELADGRTGKIINLGEFGDFDDDYKPNQKWLRIVFTNPNMDDDAWAELEDMLWSDQELTESPAVKHLSDATAKDIISTKIDLYDARSGYVKLPDGEQELLQAMYDEIVIDTGLHPDDDFEKIDQRIYDQIEADYSHVGEGNTYGAGAGGMDGVVYEDSQDDDGGFEAIQSAIIRRIAHSHHDLLMKLGPDGVLEAAREIAEFAAPVEEIGSSDVSAWVAQIERDAGIEKEHSDLHEAFEQALNEAAINVGDMIRDKTQPTIQGKVVGDIDENYIIQVEDDQYHIKKLNAEKIIELTEAVDLNQLKGQEVYVPGEGTTGVIAGQADPSKFSNSLIINLKNGQQTVVHFKDVKATKPGLGKQILDKLNAWTGGGTMPKYQPKPIGTVGDLNTPKQFQKLAGIK